LDNSNSIKSYALTINTSSSKKISLWQFLQSKVSNLSQNKHTLNATVIIEPNTHISLLDDLISHDITKLKLIFNISENSSLEYHTHIIEKKYTQNISPIIKNVTLNLNGKNSQANLTGTCFCDTNKTIIFHTKQNHTEQQAQSYVAIKSVLDNTSKLICTHTIHVHEKAHKTHARQTNKNILLSHNAHVISTPILEVKAHDVECQHGTAVSNFTDEHFFYLQSKGINKQASQTMLIQGFLS